MIAHEGSLRADAPLLPLDVAETIDLRRIPALVGGSAVAARLAPKPVTPPYVQYDKPPLSFRGDVVGVAEFEGFSVRVRVFDYGVISLALSGPFEGSWSELVGLSQTLTESVEIEQRAEQASRAIVSRLRPALRAPHDTVLSEDYLVYAINETRAAHVGR